MRIAYLSTFYPFRGGIAQFNALLYKAFESEGHTLKAYTFTCQYPGLLFPGKTQYVTAQDRAIPIESQAILNSVNPFSYIATAREIGKWKPDVLIMRYWMSFFAPAFGYIAGALRKQGVKVICIIDNALPHEPRFFDKPFARYLFNRVDEFIVMSQVVEKDLLSIKPDARYRFKPHPLYNHFGEKQDKSAARKQLGLDNDKKTLLFFGLIRDYKGLDILIEAMGLLDDSYQLFIAGESYGPFDKYQKQLDESKAKDRIKVLNQYIGDDFVPVLFSAADLLVLPYRSATQSGVIPVAYHFELPTVATDVGGLKETLEQTGTGLVCEPDPLSVSCSITDFFNSNSSHFIDNIRQEKQSLSWEAFAKAII